MDRWRLASLIVIVLGAPVVVFAQAAPDGSSTPLQRETQQRRVIVQPRPDPGAVNQDVNEAVSAMGAQERLRRDARETVLPQLRRPDLGYDVSSEIQSRNLGKVLRK